VAPHTEKLTFVRFRGGSQPVTFEFQPNKKFVLIFGENGTGKSSIVDAIDFVCNNEFGSLRDRSGTTPRTHVVSLNGQSKDLAVTLQYAGKTWEARLQGGKPITQPPNPPRAFILRRTDITRVMESTPSDRYKALHAYITVPKVEQAEGELRKAHKTMQDNVDRAVRDRTQAGDTLERLWLAEGKPDADALAWAIHKTSVGVDVQNAALAANRRLEAGIRQAQELLSNMQKADQSATATAIALAQTDQALQTAAAEQAGLNAALVDLLSDAQQYLRGLPAGELPCPLCGKPENSNILLQRIGAQLQQLTNLQRLREAQQRAQSAVVQAQGVLRSAENQFIAHCHSLPGLVMDASAEYAEAADLDALAAAANESGRLAAAAAAAAELAAVQPALAAAIEEDQKTINQWNSLYTLLQTLQVAEHTMREQQAVAERLKAMLDIVEAERKAYVDQLVRAISSDVNALYIRIHPQESLGNSALYVKPNVAGSLELRAAFGGVADVVPGAYYSEAHLDTLGLCVYLALAKQAGKQDRIIVLDDVLTSVDDAHLSRIVDLIDEEADSLGHLIITTHSQAWVDKVRTATGLQPDLIELQPWTLSNGIRHRRSP
jgi:predicted ATPase